MLEDCHLTAAKPDAQYNLTLILFLLAEGWIEEKRFYFTEAMNLINKISDRFIKYKLKLLEYSMSMIENHIENDTYLEKQKIIALEVKRLLSLSDCPDEIKIEYYTYLLKKSNEEIYKIVNPNSLTEDLCKAISKKLIKELFDYCTIDSSITDSCHRNFFERIKLIYDVTKLEPEYLRYVSEIEQKLQSDKIDFLIDVILRNGKKDVKDIVKDCTEAQLKLLAEKAVNIAHDWLSVYTLENVRDLYKKIKIIYDLSKLDGESLIFISAIERAISNDNLKKIGKYFLISSGVAAAAYGLDRIGRNYFD